MTLPESNTFDRDPGLPAYDSMWGPDPATDDALVWELDEYGKPLRPLSIDEIERLSIRHD